MSSESTLAFYGVRTEICAEQMSAIEERSDPLVVKAKQYGLTIYWGKFDLSNENYLLFVGDKFGLFGLENDRRLILRIDELVARTKQTDDKLRSAGIVGQAMLILEWQPDD